MKRYYSPIQSKVECFFCGCHTDLHLHHVFFGTANRKVSDRHHAYVYLCGMHHNMSKESVHRDHNMDMVLKKLMQTALEKTMTRDEFRREFGKSWL